MTVAPGDVAEAVQLGLCVCSRPPYGIASRPTSEDSQVAPYGGLVS